MLINSKST